LTTGLVVAIHCYTHFQHRRQLIETEMEVTMEVIIIITTSTTINTLWNLCSLSNSLKYLVEEPEM
jgi:hypothetical protein